MKKIIIWILIILFSSTYLCTAGATGTEDKKNELNKVNQDMIDTNENISNLKENQNKVSNEIDKLALIIENKELELQKINELLSVTQNHLEQSSKELIIAKEDAIEQNNMMNKRLRVMYKTGFTSYLVLLLEAKDFNDFLDRYRLISKVANFDRNLLNTMDQKEIVISEKERLLEEEKKRIQVIQNDIQQNKLSIENDKKTKTGLLARIVDQKEESEKDLEELTTISLQLEKTIRDLQAAEEAKRKLQQKLKAEEERRKLQQNLQAKEDAKRKLQRPATETYTTGKYNGKIFTWPVPGFHNITSSFGFRLHPIYKINKMHTGIDIGSIHQSNVRMSIYGANFIAASDGVVLFAGLMPSLGSGYGRCVIIDHGDGISTLYGHGSLILIQKGQNVKMGQAVMKVGSTGSSTGAHAHFEVRVNGIPANPLEFLK